MWKGKKLLRVKKSFCSVAVFVCVSFVAVVCFCLLNKNHNFFVNFQDW